MTYLKTMTLAAASLLALSTPFAAANAQSDSSEIRSGSNNVSSDARVIYDDNMGDRAEDLYGHNTTYTGDVEVIENDSVETGVDTRFENEASVDSIGASNAEVDMDGDMNTSPYEN